MEYKLKGGVTLGDDDFERMSDQAAKGDYPGAPGEWVVRPQGRPALSDEELVSITFKVPRSQRDALDAKAESCGKTRSQFMREALNKELAFA
ncbi:CopG family transcriptional regulator [Bifidobacterium sp. 64T4]|uniref:ribbon-helix-helix domain-containing protein n=1 Tax=Bifidobacterium pongonis TaxID=2834432 RepID=UPI001C58A96A|nr:ribbon-helix-helix domain-containing protein [Bifidobacterium pongonis]MBW3094358.1 CopG family transcriptional regulator [Bifidobacterium pongonis]